jgi:anti-sigma-K factor RskA
MTRSVRPDNWQDLLAGYALGNLSPEEAEVVQQLLTDDPDLIHEVDCFQEVLALMPYNAPEHEPPAHLRETILTAAAADQAVPQLFQDQLFQEPSRPAKSRPRLNWLALATPIAAAALIGLGVENYRLRQEVNANRPIVAALQQPGAQLYALEGTGKAAVASGSIVINASQQQMLVVAQNLPQLPAGQAYRLWAISDKTSGAAKTPAYCGQFNSSASGSLSSAWAVTERVCSRAPSQLLIIPKAALADV